MEMNSGDDRGFSRVLSVAVLCGLILSACTETRYMDYGKGTKQEEFPYRMVAYEIDPSFYENFPGCVLILPPSPRDSITKDLSRIIETALVRHIVRRFDRVIDGHERRNAAERYGLDIEDPSDLRSLSERLRCDTYIRTRVHDARMDYLLVWSQVGVGLDLELRNSGDDHLLWRARHKARRSEGGLSFSPLGVLTDTIFSSRFAADREIAESLADDAVRRMVVPLPNVRSF